MFIEKAAQYILIQYFKRIIKHEGDEQIFIFNFLSISKTAKQYINVNKTAHELKTQPQNLQENQNAKTFHSPFGLVTCQLPNMECKHRIRQHGCPGHRRQPPVELHRHGHLLPASHQNERRLARLRLVAERRHGQLGRHAHLGRSGRRRAVHRRAHGQPECVAGHRAELEESVLRQRQWPHHCYFHAQDKGKRRQAA